MQNVCITLGSEWDNFNHDFWAAFRAVFPDHFETLWQSLIAHYPTAQGYMAEIYDCQEHWAWAWVSHVFTAGVRTNGHVKVENHINKALGGPKKTLLQLFNNLNEQTNGQLAQEMMKTHDVCKLLNYLRDPIAHSNSELCSLLIISMHKISNLFLLDHYDFFASMWDHLHYNGATKRWRRVFTMRQRLYSAQLVSKTGYMLTTITPTITLTFCIKNEYIVTSADSTSGFLWSNDKETVHSFCHCFRCHY
jgi:hypothetical protein